MPNFQFETFWKQIGGGSYVSSTEVPDSEVYARVTHVVLGPNYVGTNIPDPYYTDPTSIGSIQFQLLKGNQGETLQSVGNPIAYPYAANLKKYPIEGEIVTIVKGPSRFMNEDFEAPEIYYKDTLNLWFDSHQNAFPDISNYAQFVNSNTNRTYQASEFSNQSDNLNPTGSVNYPLGPNFYERDDLKNLLPFPGDVILEGRWGNSIRFSSTLYHQKDLSPWSKGNTSLGNPITIIRNGQGQQLDQEGWVPTVENINRDPSSIYLTQGQEIVLDDIQNNFSLASLGVQLQSTVTNAIPLQQSLTSINSISATAQDDKVASVDKDQQQTPQIPS